MKIALISAWDCNYKPLAQVVEPNRQRYCKQHGYDYISKDDLPYEERLWGRFKLGLEKLSNYDWIVIADLDIVFTNPNIKLEQFIYTVPNPETSFIGSYDINGFNSGVIFLKNTGWSVKFFEKVFGCHAWEANPCGEQLTLAMLLIAEPQNRWQILSQKHFNAFPYEDFKMHYPEGTYAPGDFVLHIPALPLSHRIDIFRRLVSNL